MEELKKLEEVQRMITLMESHAFISSSSSSSSSSNNHHSNRFLASLLLLLIQPCGDLDIKDKFSLINEHIPKISDSFLEEASLLFNRKEKEPLLQMENITITTSNGDSEDMALVSLDAMQRANSTLEDFCRSYFMFHEMDINKPQSIFEYLPVLSFTESYIYQMDSLNEKIVDMDTSSVGVVERESHMEVSENRIVKFINVLKNDPFRPLVGQLQHHGLLTERIIEEFMFGEEYWALERKLCSALMNQTEILVEDVMRAVQLKSFDYRVLNLLLYQLRGEKVNDMHMEFLSISEFLVEVSDDLFDYEDDVLENSFNILRMFVRIYGPATAPAMLQTNLIGCASCYKFQAIMMTLDGCTDETNGFCYFNFWKALNAKYIAEAEEKYDNLLRTLDPQLSSDYQTRCEEATKEGGKMSGHPLGTWNIPPVIVDEELYRLNWLNSESVVPLG